MVLENQNPRPFCWPDRGILLISRTNPFKVSRRRLLDTYDASIHYTWRYGLVWIFLLIFFDWAQEPTYKATPIRILGTCERILFTDEFLIACVSPLCWKPYNYVTNGYKILSTGVFFWRWPNLSSVELIMVLAALNTSLSQVWKTRIGVGYRPQCNAVQFFCAWPSESLSNVIDFSIVISCDYACSLD